MIKGGDMFKGLSRGHRAIIMYGILLYVLVGAATYDVIYHTL